MSLATWVISLGLVAAGPAAPDRTGDATSAYEQARAETGRDAEAQLRLALWCEQHGLNAERRRHLALAIMADPNHAVARALLGLVSREGVWTHPEKLVDPAKAALLDEYRARRDALKPTADDHWKLAVWCEQNGLVDESTAHFTVVVRQDPGRDAAWKRLGYKKVSGRWMTDAQAATAKARAAAQKKADKDWQPKLVALRTNINSRKPATREAAQRTLASITDPLAVPMIWSVFAMKGADNQKVAAQLLGQIETADSSQLLALLSLYAAEPQTRRVALETLKHRDYRDFLALFVQLVLDPIKYEVRPPSAPGSAGVIAIHGKDANLQRNYEAPVFPSIILPQFGDEIGYDENGLPVVNRDLGGVLVSPTEVKISRAMESPAQGRVPLSIAQRSVTFLTGDSSRADELTNELFRAQGFQNAPGRVAERESFGMRNYYASIPIGKFALAYQMALNASRAKINGDIQSIEAANEQTRLANDRVLLALKSLTRQDFGENRGAWEEWWLRERGFMTLNQRTQAQPPTIFENVPLGANPYAEAMSDTIVGTVTVQRKVSCFGKGTTVRTVEGPRPIESLRVGDRLLVQDSDSGTLQVQPIVQVFHNPPTETVRVTVGGESVVATPIHRFWIAGRGWVRAEALKAGDRVRILDGVSTVESVENSGVQPVFNLEVAAGESYFVGASGMLVHDNTFVRPTPAPFDAVTAR